VTTTPEILQLAHDAIDRILGKQSELQEMWAESDAFEAWQRSVKDLRERICQLVPRPPQCE
jgi:hypothetical protein